MTTPALSVGDHIEVIDGLKQGCRGTVVAFDSVGATGVRLWRVDLGGRGVRVVREDFMRQTTKEAP